MASQTEQLTAALGAIDDGLAQLAAGFMAFRAANQSVSRAVFHARGQGEQFTLEHAIGITRVLELIVRRMRTLGLEMVLDQARTSGGLDDTIVATLALKIREAVGQ